MSLTNRTKRTSVALVLIAAAGCAPQDTSTDADEADAGFSSQASDIQLARGRGRGHFRVDSGATLDAGVTPTDAAVAADSGTPVADAGTPVADAGTPVADAGTPVVDAGTPVVDSGTPVADAGTPVADAGTAAPARVYGVTVDDIAPLSSIVSSLRGLPHRATTRVVFDEGQPPSAYTSAVSSIHAVSDVMGEILDSEYVPNITVSAYLTRTSNYLSALGSNVDIWEIGNEINGNWVDRNAGGVADVVAKMTGAYDLVHAAGRRTALTLYGCSDADRAHDMLTWANANVPARMRTGLDYVLVSFYEGDCGVSAPDWASTFHQLRLLFPNAALGFGEVGAVDRSGNPNHDVSIAGPYLQRYYGMDIREPGYIGGGFWWYYVEDMLPAPSPMYTILSDAIR